VTSSEKRKWVPEICYEDYENAEMTGGLPFIHIPTDKEMPNVLFFFSSQDTGEFEPDLEGEAQPIVEMELYQFACMKYLQSGLDPDTYDKVRVCLGLLPLGEARQKGRKHVEKQVEIIREKSQK
jgi:hypothetical protein